MPLDLSKTATKLLKKLGSETYVTLLKYSGRVFDPVTGKHTSETVTPVALTAAVMSVTDNLVDGERILAGDKRVIFDNAATPDMQDLIEFGGEQYKIVNIDGFNHAGTQQYWEVICRK
jgi:hypothetical protein